MNNRQLTAFAAVITVLTIPNLLAQTPPLWSDSFDDNNPIGWSSLGNPVGFVETNGQFSLTGTFTSPMNPLNFGTHHVPAYHSIPSSGPLPDQQTFELRVDLVSANQDDAWAGLSTLWASQGTGYIMFVDQNEVLLCKYYNGAASLASFFYTNVQLKSQNMTMVLSFTRDGSNLKITTRLLDKDNANAVLFERTVTDTPATDPVLPSGTVRGFAGAPDPAGTPWPLVTIPDMVGLTLQWVNSEHGPNPLASVIFDNLQVSQYESPQLVVASAIVLSWPLTQGQFVLESATNASGPWEQVSDPWWRTNNAQNEVSIRAPDSLRLFRLRQVP